MNIILFTADEIQKPLSLSDPRAAHILNVLKAVPGQAIRAGIINGPQGSARIISLDGKFLYFSFEPGDEGEGLLDLVLIAGLCRPHSAQKILREAASLGVGKMYFVRTELSEKSYAMSKLWTAGAYKRFLLEGTGQAYSTRLPEIKLFLSLDELLEILPGGLQIMLEIGEKEPLLSDIPVISLPVTLAVGSERGWTRAEREVFLSSGFKTARLGQRILRTETAVLCGLSIVLSKLGKM
ncbi:MAG: 16S rRNA (uracil(1498)-N(3))-methyltransferase [Spirochaetales bacterium]|nr:16S rRNA (uracil(1498)-N(3))-methyltransferase [Spirochaetales bacterium]